MCVCARILVDVVVWASGLLVLVVVVAAATVICKWWWQLKMVVQVAVGDSDTVYCCRS